MAVQPFRVKRWGVEKNGEVGNLPGKSRCNTVTVEPQEPHILPVKEAPVKIVIELDRINLTGEALKIETTWAKGYVTPGGTLTDIQDLPSPMLTADPDLADFSNQLSGIIMRFVLNGKVRAIEGHNDKPVFYSKDVKDASGQTIHYAGQVITYTEEQENEPPTGGYYSPPVDPEPTEPA